VFTQESADIHTVAQCQLKPSRTSHPNFAPPTCTFNTIY
jgi:hypothetical protein